MQTPVHDYRRWHIQHLFPVLLLTSCSSNCKHHEACSFSPPGDPHVLKKYCNHIFLKDEYYAAMESCVLSFSSSVLQQRNLTPPPLKWDSEECDILNVLAFFVPELCD